MLLTIYLIISAVVYITLLCIMEDIIFGLLLGMILALFWPVFVIVLPIRIIIHGSWNCKNKLGLYNV